MRKTPSCSTLDSVEKEDEVGKHYTSQAVCMLSYLSKHEFTLFFYSNSATRNEHMMLAFIHVGSFPQFADMKILKIS